MQHTWYHYSHTSLSPHKQKIFTFSTSSPPPPRPRQLKNIIFSYGAMWGSIGLLQCPSHLSTWMPSSQLSGNLYSHIPYPSQHLCILLPLLGDGGQGINPSSFVRGQWCLLPACLLLPRERPLFWNMQFHRAWNCLIEAQISLVPSNSWLETYRPRRNMYFFLLDALKSLQH